LALDQAIAQAGITGKVKTKEEEKVFIQGLKQKLSKFGYTGGEIEYIIRNCSTEREVQKLLISQLEIAQKCLDIK